MPFNLFSPIIAKVLAGTSLALLLAFGVQTARLNIRTDQRDNYKLANDTMKKAYTAAEATATAKAIAAKLTTEAGYRVKAEKTDAEYQTALARAQRASDAYRLRSQIPRGASNGAASPANGSGPESPDRPSSSTELVAVTRDDFDILVENSVRLEAAHDWAKTLNAGAVPDPTFAVPVN